MPVRVPSQSRLAHQAKPTFPRKEPPSVIPISTERFVDLLTQMTVGNLVIRGGGLSVFHPCQPRFLSGSDAAKAPDTDDGLRVRVDLVEAIWLIESELEPARFEIEMKEGLGSFSYFPSPNLETRSALSSLKQEAIAMSRINGLEPPPMRAEWLDQQLDSASEKWRVRLGLETRRDGATAFVEMKSVGLSFDCSFLVASFDTISQVFRLASSGAMTAVHFTTHEMKLLSTSNGLELTHGDSHNERASALLESWAAPFLYR